MDNSLASQASFILTGSNVLPYEHVLTTLNVPSSFALLIVRVASNFICSGSLVSVNFGRNLTISI